MVAWSSAAALADAYSRPWQQAGIYAMATGVSLTRVLAQQHFPTDVLLGSVSGWLIGHYVAKVHRRPSVLRQREHLHP
jgi:membrane-associated phospholipid phosphatase